MRDLHPSRGPDVNDPSTSIETAAAPIREPLPALGSPTADPARLELLHEVGRDLVSILDRQELLERVAELIKRLIDYNRFSVLLWDDDERRLESIHSVTWGGCPGRQFGIGEGRGLLGTAVSLKRPVRVSDVRSDPRYVNCGDQDVRSELVLPLLIKDRLIGALDFESYRQGAFSQDDERLLMTLAASIAIALENAALYERVRQDERRLAKELRTAREMQRFLLPRSTPWRPGLQTAVAYRPARDLGGDLYDFLPYGEGRTAIAVGDVAGKGTSAALYGSLAIGLLRGYMSDNRCQPSCVLDYLNEELRQLEAEKRFLAMVFAVYDSRSRVLSVANAGLPYPLLVRGGEIREIGGGNLPVGSMSATRYHHLEVGLEAGDLVVFTTDGIDECRNAAGEAYGSERLNTSLLELAPTESAKEVAEGLLAATERHLAGQALVDATQPRFEPSDDRTIVVLRIGEE